MKFSIPCHLLSLIAEPSVSDTFPLEGKSKFPPSEQNISQRMAGSEMSSDSLYRWAAILSVFLRGWGWGSVSVLRLLATADLKLQSESSLRFTVQSILPMKTWSRPAALSQPVVCCWSSAENYEWWVILCDGRSSCVKSIQPVPFLYFFSH